MSFYNYLLKDFLHFHLLVASFVWLEKKCQFDTIFQLLCFEGYLKIHPKKLP